MDWKLSVIVSIISFYLIHLLNNKESFDTLTTATFNNLPLWPGYDTCRPKSQKYKTMQMCFIKERQQCRPCGAYSDNLFEYKFEPGYWDSKTY